MEKEILKFYKILSKTPIFSLLVDANQYPGNCNNMNTIKVCQGPILFCVLLIKPSCFHYNKKNSFLFSVVTDRLGFNQEGKLD
jgi:hypothetical protein